MATSTISSKGQIVIPSDIRDDLGWCKGTKINIQETPFGVMLFELPEKPLKAMRGILRGFKITRQDIKRMRKRDERHDKTEKSVV